MIEKICLRCGNELPITCGPSRKYCDACAAARNRELTRERQKKAVKLMREAKAEKQSAKDRAYCKPCVYAAAGYGEHLCDYILRTGHRRGCKAGVGCRKREVVE